jgi:arginyl-tRNA synthetase
MLSFEGNTSPYLQYAHARICSIFSKSNISRNVSRNSKFNIFEKEEQLLSRRLLAFSSHLEETMTNYSPHRLCNYLYSLASSFASFYENCPVLKSENKEIMHSRLALCDLTARTLNLGMELLGIECPEEM